MENDRVAIAALLFIILIVGINFVMYGIVRGMTRGGESNWMSALRKSLNKPLEGSANKSMDELRKKVEELQGKNEKKQD
ncbi:MAG: hypothetical protein HGA79_07345 [Anaerolineales bacterium]|jgi:hypothetical protein|nr:hypothetical protein [Anaerolineales bacterium]